MMYKPVPQAQSSSNDGEDSESELFSSAHFDEKSLQYDDHMGDTTSQQQLMEQPAMSTSRKVALTLSIVNCVAFIIIFLWILPCDYDTCKAPLKVKFIEWEVNLTGKGVQAMSVASSKTSRSKETLILMNNELTPSSSLCFSNQTNNVLGLRAADGKVVWEKNFTEAIQYFNCSLIDVNNDGVDDCLLFPVVNSFSAIDSLTGALLWQHQFFQPVLRTNEASRIKIIDVDSVADLNNDAVSDIIVIMSDSVTRFFTGLSGKNGEMLWQIPLNVSCIPIDRPASVDYVISNSCFKQLPEFTGTNNTSRLLIRRASPPGFPLCLKCDALTNGIPETHYLFHGSVNRFLVTAMVNCTSGTQVKKTLLDI